MLLHLQAFPDERELQVLTPCIGESVNIRLQIMQISVTQDAFSILYG